MSCETGELGVEWRDLGLVGRGYRHWEGVRLEYIMLPAWTWRVAGVSHRPSPFFYVPYQITSLFIVEWHYLIEIECEP